MITTARRRHFTGIAASLFALTAVAGPLVSVQAQTHPHRNFAQRHPTATGAAAGLGAYALAKKTGNNRARAGRHRNFAQRHPVVTGVAAGMIAHHYAKKHRR